MTSDHDKLLARINEMLPKEEWTKWPGGWPGDIEAALIDAVFSARAQYRTKKGRGVHRLVTDWRHARSRETYSLRAFEAEIGQPSDASAWAQRFGSSQHSPGRPADSPGGPTKAAAVLEAAQRLLALQPAVNVAEDITEKNTKDVATALQATPGIGKATSNYFLMLLGRPGVKPDRMVIRFVQCAIGRRPSASEAERLVSGVAVVMDVPAHELDNAIWKLESARAEGGERDGRS